MHLEEVIIKGSINIGFEKGLANWVGMAVEPGSDILLIVNSEEEYNEMCIHLHLSLIHI